MTKLNGHLERIKALHEAATEGPWMREERDKEWRLLSTQGNGGRYVATVLKSSPIGGEMARMEDSWRTDTLDFIADSRISVPKMERMIRAQARVIEALRECTTFRDPIPEKVRQEAIEAASALAKLLEKEWS